MFNATKYVISLPERSDRRRDFIISAARAKVSDYRFFPAIKGEGKKEAQRACRLSHKKLISFARDLDLPHITILEDDAVLAQDILSRISQINLPPDWDMFYLGAHNHKPLKPISENLGQSTYSLSTVGYIVRNTLFNLITDDLNDDLPLDMIYVHKVQPFFKCYCTIPNLVTQAPGFSDIELKLKDYSKYYAS